MASEPSDNSTLLKFNRSKIASGNSSTQQTSAVRDMLNPTVMVVIIAQTSGYPYFLQEWGKHSWNVAAGTPIKAADARRGLPARAHLARRKRP